MIMTSPYPYGMGAEGSSWPKSFIFFSTDIIFTQLPEWELIRILDADGHLLASPYGRIEDALPISAEGLQALKSSRNGGKSSRSRTSASCFIAVPVVSDGELVSILQIGRPLTERDRSLRDLSDDADRRQPDHARRSRSGSAGCSPGSPSGPSAA